MAPHASLKTSFKTESSIKSTYSGTKVVLSKDGTLLATSHGQHVFLHNLKDESILPQSYGHQAIEGDDEEEDTITSFIFSSDNESLFVSMRSLVINQWLIKTRTCIKSWKPHDSPVLCMGFDTASTTLLTGSSDHTLKLWDTSKNTLVAHAKGHSGIITFCLFHPSRQEFYSGSSDGSVRIWTNSTNVKCLGICKGHVAVVTELCISPCGNYLISSSRDKMVYIWDLSKRTLHKSIAVSEAIESLTAVPTTTTTTTSPLLEWALWTGGERGIIKIWDPKSGTQMNEYQADFNTDSTDLTIFSLIYDTSQSQVIRAASDHTLLFIGSESPFQLNKLIIGYNQEITDLVFVSSDTFSQLAVSTNASQLRLYDTTTRNGMLLKGHTDIVLCLASCPSMGFFVSGSKDTSARLWQLSTNEPIVSAVCIGICQGHTEAVGAVAIAHHGSLPFIVTGSQDTTIKYWHYAGSLLGQHETMAFLSSSFTIKAHEKDINALDISPNDKLIASASQDKTAKIWKSIDGSCLGVLHGHKRGIWGIKFSPVDQCVVTSSADQTIKIWSITSFTCLKTFEGHTQSVLKSLFFNHGSQLVSCGSDGLVKIWDIKSNECVTTLDSHTDKIWALAVTSGEQRIVSGGADSDIHIWRDCTQEENQAKHAEASNILLQEQQFSNFVISKEYGSAIYLALHMKQPFRLLSLFKELLYYRQVDFSSDVESSLTGSPEVDLLLSQLDEEEITTLLGFLKDWNTQFKNSLVCQTILHILLKSRTLSSLIQLSMIKDTIQALLPYTEKHLEKLDDLCIQFQLLDFTLTSVTQ